MESTRSARRIGYVVSRFPKLSETFILREMDVLETLGWDVTLFSLIAERDGRVHAAAVPWMSRVRVLPMLSVAVVLANLRAALRRPVSYAGLWTAVACGYAGTPASLVRALVLLPSCVRLAELVRRGNVPQLHAHYATYPLLACWVVHRLTGTPYSVTVHAHDIFVATPMALMKMAPAGAVVAISEFNRQYLAREISPELLPHTTVVHCGVDLSRYREAAREPDGVLDVLCVGSLQPYKGQTHLVRATRLLVDRGSAVRCTLVGHGPDEGMLRREIAAAGLGDVVLLAGPCTEDQVAHMLSHADVYVQPSVVAPDGQMEGIPVAIMEALASGLPVVAAALSGIPELVRHGETGWLVPPGDAAALAAALQDVAARPAEAANRGRAGRALVDAEFNLHRNVSVLSSVLSDLFPSKGAPA